MLANFHTHSTFCDGKNTPEQIVLAAIEKGFQTIGFSGHGNTPFDLRYCMKDTEGYRAEILRLKQKYGKRIRILLGAEEDAFSLVDRERFDYIIGSSHYVFAAGQYYPIDSGLAYFNRCLEALDNDPLRLAKEYYGGFCRYIKERKPDIVGHFDLITKFDEVAPPLFLENAAYHRIAEAAICEAAQSGCAFEVNTGAIARGLRTRPYPLENLLLLLRERETRLLLSADSHSIETLDFAFEETKRYLYDLGFRRLYTLTEEGFSAYSI